MRALIKCTLITIAVCTITSVAAEEDMDVDINTFTIIGTPRVRQSTGMFCGPAIAESVLRHVGLTEQNVLSTVEENPTFQRRLASVINTVVGYDDDGFTACCNHGTFPVNWAHGVNTVLRQNRINRGFYQILNINPPRYRRDGLGTDPEAETNYRIFFFEELDRLVRLSLANNMPVAFAQAFQPSYRENGYGRHFVLIDGIGQTRTVNHGGPTRYRIMDPGTGEYNYITAQDIYYRAGDAGYLIYFTPSNVPTQYTNFDLVNFQNRDNVINTFVRGFFFCNQASSVMKRSVSAQQCPAISHPFHNNGDIVTAFYDNYLKRTCKVKFTKNTAVAIDYIQITSTSKNNEDLRNYLSNLFKSMKYATSLDSDDLDTINYLINNYSAYHTKVQEMIQDPKASEMLLRFSCSEKNNNPEKEIHLVKDELKK